MRPNVIYNKVSLFRYEYPDRLFHTIHQSSFLGGPGTLVYCPKGEIEAQGGRVEVQGHALTLPSSSPQRPHRLVLPQPASFIPSHICLNPLGPPRATEAPPRTMLMRGRESPPHGVMQIKHPEAPPLAPSLSLRGAARPTASPISVSARGACRPVRSSCRPGDV